MAQACEKSCYTCDASQSYKLNFAMVHGVCSDHVGCCKASIIICSHCQCHVPVNKLTSPEVCPLCQTQGFLVQFKCGHSACFVCAKVDRRCVECDHNCDICKQTSTIKTLNCGHTICERCSKNSIECPLCRNNNVASKLPGAGSHSEVIFRHDEKIDACENCKNSILYEILPCGHQICEQCHVRKICPMCPRANYDRVSTRECISCIIN